ncbi:MAG: phage virion morphogenesis protein [Pseudomonas sp.]|uniref:phage virion morphogenesis protein n=1 Tax=Pseudomonas sp. TaxID=306 RepID=UPI0033942521
MSGDGFDALEDWAGALLNKMEPAARRTLARDIARDLRRSTAQRIAGQRNPDGSRFEKRKPRKEPKTTPVRFIYQTPGAEPREVLMRSWVFKGGLMTGFDREADGIRSFRKDRIVRHLPAPSGSGGGTGTRGMARKQGAIRRRMFDRLRTAKHLKTRSDTHGATVGFFGRVARLARIHQFGERDKVGKIDYQYPKRELLGFTDADRELITALIVRHING